MSAVGWLATVGTRPLADPADHQVVAAALGAAGAGETVGENAALEIAAELPLDRSRGVSPVVGCQLFSKSCRMTPVAIATRT